MTAQSFRITNDIEEGFLLSGSTELSLLLSIQGLKPEALELTPLNPPTHESPSAKYYTGKQVGLFDKIFKESFFE